MLKFELNLILKFVFSDNTKEYLPAPFSSFLSSHGILHQSSYAYTPQQNGVAKPKKSHLIETTRTCLLHHKVPQHFLGNATLAACYLINRMPSYVLHDQISHSIIFPNQPLFYLPPCVFGCVCLVHSLTLGQDKLSAKVMKCVFLSYSQLERGYHCYSLDTHQYFVFVDVTFLKNSSMFLTTLLPNFDVLSQPLLFPVPDTSYVPPTTPRPLWVYTQRPRSNTKPLANSSPMALSSMTSVLPSTANLPIAIWKSIHSSCNAHRVYSFLTYHCLSSPYSAFISTCLLFHFLNLCKMLSPIRDENRQWLKKWLLSILLAHGT